MILLTNASKKKKKGAKEGGNVTVTTMLILRRCSEIIGNEKMFFLTTPPSQIQIFGDKEVVLMKCTDRESNFQKENVSGWKGASVFFSSVSYGKIGTNVDEKFDSIN